LFKIDAQQIFGAITGTVKDSSGAAVPSARVTVRNTATNIQSTVQTKGDGGYTVPNLQVGSYEVSFSAAGFEKESHTNIVVQGDRNHNSGWHAESGPAKHDC
jgi:hypothetical protein